MICIDAATANELPTVARLCVDAVNDLRERQKLPEADLERIVEHIYDDYQVAPCFVIKEHGIIIGFASLCHGQHFWSDERYLSTSMVYIKPEKRKYAILEKLYKKIKEHADLQGMPYLDHYMCHGEIDARRKTLRSLNLKEYGIIIGY